MASVAEVRAVADAARYIGDYPKREMWVELGRMEKAEREEDALFGLCLREKTKPKECKRVLTPTTYS